MQLKDYFTMDFLFVIIFGAFALFSLTVMVLGATGIKPDWPCLEVSACECRCIGGR